MNRISHRLAAVIACAALALPLSSVAAEEPKKWNLVLNNAKNVQTDLGVDKTEVEIAAGVMQLMRRQQQGYPYIRP